MSVIKLFTDAKSGLDIPDKCLVQKERDPAMLDRKMAKLEDQTTGRRERGIIHIDRYISTHPRYRIIYIGPVHMGYPSCSSSVLYVSTRE